jgi:hypothetical protein
MYSVLSAVVVRKTVWLRISWSVAEQDVHHPVDADHRFHLRSKNSLTTVLVLPYLRPYRYYVESVDLSFVRFKNFWRAQARSILSFSTVNHRRRNIVRACSSLITHHSSGLIHHSCTLLILIRVGSWEHVDQETSHSQVVAHTQRLIPHSFTSQMCEFQSVAVLSLVKYR